MIYNRVKETPTYAVEYYGAGRLVIGKKYTITHAGLYMNKAGHFIPYVDTCINGIMYRIQLGDEYIDTIDELSHNDKFMRFVHDGFIQVSRDKDGKIETGWDEE